MKKNLNLEKILAIFIILQPFLDFYMLYSEQVTSIFKFSPSTIIRIIFVSFFAIYVLFKTKYNKKYFWILGYLILVLVYLIMHVLNALQFNTSIGNHFSFSYITELFYFIRMFIPIILIYITYHSKLTEENFRKIIITVSLIFSLIIIITNILGIALTSYGGNNTISANIFSWFTNNNYKFEQLASKGFFYMANQISGVLMLLLPINLYYAIKTLNKISIISSFCLSLAMIMLGTRIATYGWALVSFAIFIAWMFFAIIHKNKINATPRKALIYSLITIILVLITINSPLNKRISDTDFANLENENLSTEIKKKFKDINTDEETKEFIKKYSVKYSIPLVYIENLYPYTEDSNFWIDTMKLPYSERGGNRNLENLITKRIYNLNNNKFDKYLGMGYSRFRNAEIYIEQDFVVHYYTIGIFGILLFIGPYFVVASFAIIYMIINKRLRMRTTILCMSVYLTLAISYFSGHILDELIVTIILGFISGFILKDVFDCKKQLDSEKNKNFKNISYKKDKPFISVIVPVYNVEKYIEKCLNSLINQTLKNIEIIVVNDGTKDNSQDIIDKYTKKYKNITSYTKKNGGLSSARNYGMKKAKGEYISFIDSDDYVDIHMYEDMYNKAKEKDFDLVVCNLKYVYDTKEVLASSNLNNDLLTKDQIKKSYLYIYPAAWNKIYKKDLLKNIEFKEKIWFEDVEFLYRLYPNINNMGYINKHYYYYVQRDGAITSTFNKKLYDYISNWNGIIDFYKKENLYNEYKNELEYCYVRYIYATFVKRAVNYKNKKEYNLAVDEAIKNVKKQFPNYRHNKYFYKSLKGIYLLIFNKKIANIVYFIEKR